MTDNLQVATFGGGCFWCIEAIFNEVKGVENVISGYANGMGMGKPTYKEVCSGMLKFIEVVQIYFDSDVISYEELAIMFMTAHNPTSTNQKENDKDIQYKSVILYETQEQEEIAHTIIKEIQPYFRQPITTEVEPLRIFHEAEEEHQNYYKNNPEQPYCTLAITPKLKKFKQQYISSLKTLG